MPAVYPQLDTRQMEVPAAYINGCIGVDLPADKVRHRRSLAAGLLWPGEACPWSAPDGPLVAR